MLNDEIKKVSFLIIPLCIFFFSLSYIDSLPSGCSELDWIPFSNSCYLFSDDTMNWTQAKDYCEKQGALLLKIGSEKEWVSNWHTQKPFSYLPFCLSEINFHLPSKEFASSFANPQEYWVGLTDQNTGEWRWADDTPYTMNTAWVEYIENWIFGSLYKSY